MINQNNVIYLLEKLTCLTENKNLHYLWCVPLISTPSSVEHPLSSTHPSGQHPKSLSSTPLQFNTSKFKTSVRILNWRVFGVDPRGVELRWMWDWGVFGVQLRDLGDWKAVTLFCWTDVLNWGGVDLRGTLFAHF